MNFIKQHLDESIAITKAIDSTKIEAMVNLLAEIKSSGGRLFVLGVGGSAANACHAVNDFRKLAGIETYAPNTLYILLKLLRKHHKFYISL